MNTAIQIKDLNKSYNTINAVNNVNIEVEEGELFGLIGPDGAGKTSIIRILATLLLPSSGSATVFGYDTKKDYKSIRNIIGYMPSRFSLYMDLTVEENLNLFAKIFSTSIEENYHLIKEIYSQIEPFKKRPAGKLSGGMKQKLALSCALIHKPRLLLLDEPTTGVDPVSRKEFWDMLKRLKAAGITIFVSTPYMDEASLCDRVALMQNANIMQIDTPQNIIDSFENKLFAISSQDKYHLINHLHEYSASAAVHPFGEYIHFSDKKSIDTNNLEAFLKTKNHVNLEIHEIKASIEDCFIELMERN